MYYTRCRSPREKGNFRGLFGPFKSIGNLRCSSRCSVTTAFAAKGIIQSPITESNRRDHSVCQASANSILKISGRRRCGISTAQEVVWLHSAGEVWYLRLPRFRLWVATFLGWSVSCVVVHGLKSLPHQQLWIWQIERFFRQSQNKLNMFNLFWHCCQNGNNIEATFDFAERIVQLVAMLLRHCCL